MVLKTRALTPFLVALALSAGLARSQPATLPSTQPIATDRSPVGDLLRKWWAEGTAAGNVGDWYDNRDREHSGLNMRPYPQLQKIAYTEEELRVRADWAASHVVRPVVVFGNSSTSAGVQNGGSNVRMYYTNPRGLPFLYRQYTHNNLYMYPAHFDYKPSRIGSPGWGDVYPTNTPYLITSLGSSGTDQPFMRAVAFTLAAFRPEVKKKLIDTGLLMPTIQLILRSTNKHLKSADEYLTGKAHPAVFEGAWVDDLKMVNLAHAITTETIPPMVQIKVLQEEKPVNGRDFFEPAGFSEIMADTPCAIARIWRGSALRRQVTLSAEDSFDVNKKPLTYKWVVLHGDPSRINIKPINDSQSQAQITIAYPDRSPVAEGSDIRNNRAEIGVFVSNGVYWSAPAFFTFVAFDSEARTYDKQGNILEVGYGMGETELAVANWTALFDALAAEPPAPAMDLLKRTLTKDDVAGLLKLAEPYKAAQAALKAAQDEQKTAQALQKAATTQKITDEQRKQFDAVARSAGDAVKKAQDARDDLLAKPQPRLIAPAKTVLEGALAKLAGNQAFYVDRRKLIDSLVATDASRKNALANAIKRLVATGLATDDKSFTLHPVRPAEGFTSYESMLIRRFNADLLSAVLYPGMVSASFKAYYADTQLSPPKTWRDVYQYDKQGVCTGWKRYDSAGMTDFAPDGRVAIKRDAQGRPAFLRAVKYEQEPLGPTQRGRELNWKPLKQVWADPQP